MSDLSDIRDEVFIRIGLAQLAESFSNNDFTLAKVWQPRERLEDLISNHPDGKVYVVGGTPGDITVVNRSNAGLREFSVHVAFQVAPIDPADVSAIDAHVQLVQELETVCRQSVDPESFSWTRLEYFKDENDIPLAFINLREAHTFEAYFTAFYNRVLP